MRFRTRVRQPLGGMRSQGSSYSSPLRERWRHHPQQPREGTDTIPSSHERELDTIPSSHGRKRHYPGSDEKEATPSSAATIGSDTHAFRDPSAPSLWAARSQAFPSYSSSGEEKGDTIHGGDSRRAIRIASSRDSSAPSSWAARSQRLSLLLSPLGEEATLFLGGHG